MVRKRRTGNRQHPWAHLEGDFQIMMTGQKSLEQRQSREFRRASDAVVGAVRATGAKILRSWGIRNPLLAAREVTQDWFVKMVESGFERCRKDLPFYPFGYVIFLGLCANFGRREPRSGVPLIEQWIVDPRSQVRPLEVLELDKAVHRAVERLPLQLRDAVKSQYFENLSAAKAAEKYGTTPSIMDQRRFRGRKKLGILLKELDPRRCAA